MKKLLMVLLLVLGLACAGGGYYIFVLKPEQDAKKLQKPKKIEKPKKEPVKTEEKKAPPPKPITEYFVSTEELGVRDGPSYDAFINDHMYRGEKVTILERKGDWGRISRYYVYSKGGKEEADWLPMVGLATSPPVITEEERRATLISFVGKSDDFKLHETAFLKATDTLLKEDKCRPQDFQELEGWVKSVKYKDREVYFVYCGGLQLSNKIYLDVKTGQIFE
ncbi:hypothetical protein [Vibrio marisflavi]|uniref:SH3 domain-containing protein n=1 Tax=Vibrio marisflavi CECT 7928 TaxID=634439 RepID=A0ABN8DZ78_9VIBR|nr:hypothetical protein [Vibrio marisflavi]CAH0536997.1 hypothetical protein VMF7928_00855 [Vibrio marisflavi CECT 7928]